MLTRWGGFVARHARAVLLVGVLVVAAAAAYGGGVFDHLGQGGYSYDESESTKAATIVDRDFQVGETDVAVIYSSDSMRVGDPGFRDSVEGVVSSLPDDAVESVTTWYDTRAPGMVADDAHSTLVTISLNGADDDALMDAYDEVEPRLDAAGLDSQVAGQMAIYGDVNDTVSEDIERAEMLSMPLVLLLSLVIFGSVVAALLPVGIGAVAVVGSFGVVRLLTEITDVSVFAINIITLLGLGLAIDYALFIVSRFREERDSRGDDRDAVNAAVAATVATAGRTVMFSGLTVAAAMSSLLVFPQGFLRSMAFGGIAAVLVAMVASLTLLPAVLAVLGRRVEVGAMPWRRRRAASLTGSHAWGRFAHAVMRRPWVSIVAVTLLLAGLALPFLRADFGSVDERVLPTDSSARISTEQMEDTFDVPAATASIVLSGASESQAKTYVGELANVDGVGDVRPVETAQAGGETVSLIEASWDSDGQSEASQQIVRDLRDVPTPGDSTALIGGESAETVDLLDSLADRLPWMAGIVVAVMLVLLFLAFGSVVLPLKAVVVNILSIGASFGVVTWIFQDGHLSDLLGFESPGYLDATQPILMLAILFGLSMDYEVFLLSRVREQWDATHDNTVAVARGVQSTGRIITSAALLLAVVIGAFATSGILFMKMIGVGMLVALLLDATVVRLVLVPAAMKVMNRANWWAPGPLLRWWERHGIREAPSTPPRVDEDELAGAR
ncbi:MMPL family transporter [Solicola gregarius]|uniref:MMPL family transporter n=1 Tax=Solicola gregarius TaxID=2908642 RepID=A0AA46TFZ5_9ACTN|nr:MMPL family transporter [Solicola gregarius]UYM04540.1 MMPL family transporter [Solicola gregarius]